MGLSLKPRNLKRYKNVARLLFRYGRSDVVRNAGLDEALRDNGDSSSEEASTESVDLARDLEKLGPTFIKLGQLLSTRSDLLPVRYTEALSRLQNDLEPFPFEEAEKIITTELGVRLSRAFSEFDPKPVAAASLAQVHRACMRDGRPVAVKVQRPGIREQVSDDLEALEDIAELLQKHTRTGHRYQCARLVEEFRRSLFRELDYRQEAHNLLTLRENLQEYPGIVVPAPIADFSSGRVLTMEYISGQKVTSLGPMVKMDIPGADLADQLFRAYLQQILVDGFLHADPHPGNVFLTDDHRLALLDLGMVIRLKQDVQQKLMELLLAISEGRGDDAARAILDLGESREDEVDKVELGRAVSEMVARNKDAKVENVEIGRILMDAARTAAECGLRFPSELSMVGQTLLKLDHVGRILAPDFKPNDSIRQNALKTMRQRMAKGATLGQVLKTARDVRDFAGGLPSRINRVLSALSEGEFEMRIKTIDEHRLMEGMQKVANRITTGLVLAALIVGAALLMRVDTPFRILGYPGLAMVFFLCAAIGGCSLMVTILFRDDRPHPRRFSDG